MNDGVYHFEWQRPRLVRITSAYPHWGFMRNTYPTGKRWFAPGCTIGVAFYLNHWGLSLLWGKPRWEEN